MARLVGGNAKLIIGDSESHVDFGSVTIEPEEVTGQPFLNMDLEFEITLDFRDAKHILEVENGRKIAISAFGEFRAGDQN